MVITPTVVDVIEQANTDGTLTVWPVWSNVDQTRGHGITIAGNAPDLRARLIAAILANAPYPHPEVARDGHGRTWVVELCVLRQGHVSSDLAALGF